MTMAYPLPRNPLRPAWRLTHTYTDLKGRTLERWGEVDTFPTVAGTVPSYTGRSFFQGRVQVNYSFFSGAALPRIDREELVFKFSFAVQNEAQAFEDFDRVARAVLKRRGSGGMLLVYEKAEAPPE